MLIPLRLSTKLFVTASLPRSLVNLQTTVGYVLLQYSFW